jgi:hypothetical protein
VIGIYYILDDSDILYIACVIIVADVPLARAAQSCYVGQAV